MKKLWSLDHSFLQDFGGEHLAQEIVEIVEIRLYIDVFTYKVRGKESDIYHINCSYPTIPTWYLKMGSNLDISRLTSYLNQMEF